MGSQYQPPNLWAASINHQTSGQPVSTPNLWAASIKFRDSWRSQYSLSHNAAFSNRAAPAAQTLQHVRGFVSVTRSVGKENWVEDNTCHILSCSCTLAGANSCARRALAGSKTKTSQGSCQVKLLTRKITKGSERQRELTVTLIYGTKIENKRRMEATGNLNPFQCTS